MSLALAGRRFAAIISHYIAIRKKNKIHEWSVFVNHTSVTYLANLDDHQATQVLFIQPFSWDLWYHTLDIWMHY